MRVMASLWSLGRVSFLLITTASVAVATACSSGGSSSGGGDDGTGGGTGGSSTSTGGAEANTGGAATGMGGATGSGGAPQTNDCTDQETASTGADPLIDDLETLAEDGSPGGDNAIPEVDGRLGYWYTYNDATPGATQEPVGDFVPTADGYNSSYSAMTSGADFAEWGAGVGVNFNTVGDIGCPYDASVYMGISLCVKGTGSASVRITTAATTPVAEGGQCTGDGCYDHFATSIALTADWACHEIRWADLSQGGWGTTATFDPATLIAFQVQFSQNTTFEIYIDDLTFLTT